MTETKEAPNTKSLRDFTEIRPCVIEGAPDAHTVWLVVGNQQFCVTPLACDSQEEAEWFRAALITALRALVAQADTEIEKYRKLLTKALPLIEAEADSRDAAMKGDSDRIYTAGDYWTEMRELDVEIAKLLK